MHDWIPSTHYHCTIAVQHSICDTFDELRIEYCGLCSDLNLTNHKFTKFLGLHGITQDICRLMRRFYRDNYCNWYDMHDKRNFTTLSFFSMHFEWPPWTSLNFFSVLLRSDLNWATNEFQNSQCLQY